MKKSLAGLLCLILMLMLAGCTSASNESTEAVSIPIPTSDDTEVLVGEWHAKDDVLNIDQYFYSSHNMCAVIKDNEEDYWFFTGKWNYDSNQIQLTELKGFQYDDQNASWVSYETSDKYTLDNIVFNTEKDKFSADQTLINDSNQTMEYTKEVRTLETPKLDDLKSYIDALES